MRLPSPRPKNKLIIIAVLLFVIAAAATTAWVTTTQQSTKEFQSKITAHSSTVKHELEAGASELKAATSEGDSKKSAEILSSLQATLNKQADEMPVGPTALGIQLVSNDIRDTAETLRERVRTLAEELGISRAILQYAHDATHILQVVTTKVGANAEQQKALAQAWQDTHTKLKALAPPRQIADVHTNMTDIVAKIQASLAALPDLYTKKDINGFAAKQKEIDTHITELRKLGQDIEESSKAQDIQVANAAHQVLHSLQ